MLHIPLITHLEFLYTGTQNFKNKRAASPQSPTARSTSYLQHTKRDTQSSVTQLRIARKDQQTQSVTNAKVSPSIKTRQV